MKKNEVIRRKNEKNNEKGITLMVLTITIIVLLILAGITINIGTDSVEKAKLEGLKTNMLLIQTKAKEYVENARFDLGIEPENANETMQNNAKAELKGTLVNDNDPIADDVRNMGINIDNGNVYKLTTDNLKEMGINDVESNDTDGWYIIVYDVNNTNAEIYHTIGYDGKHSLTDIEQIEI